MQKGDIVIWKGYEAVITGMVFGKYPILKVFGYKGKKYSIEHAMPEEIKQKYEQIKISGY